MESKERETKAKINKCKNRQTQSKRRQLQRDNHRKGTIAKADKLEDTKAKGCVCKSRQKQRYK